MQYLKEEVKNNIITAAVQEFMDKGYHEASMRTIAANAGIALGNVYRYFQSKDDLFNQIVEPAYTKFTSMVFELYEYHDPVPEIRLLAESITDKIMEFFDKYQTELLILIDKSKGSKYENVKEDLIKLVDHRIKCEIEPILKAQDKKLEDDYIFYVIATAFMEGTFMIIRKYKDQSKIKDQIGLLLIIFFDDFYNHFK
ncbi:MAG: transcriptional regulator [Herbinix sp.]|nr:transcriptional regulator [Herbinix sp.]